MSTITIMLDPSSPAFKTLQRELHDYLTSLETVEFRTEARPAEAGKLAGEEDVFKYVIENATAIINLVAAIMVLVAQAKASENKEKKKTKEKEEKPVIVEVNGKRISLPASESTRKKFLKIVEGDLKNNKSSNILKKKPRK